jgi:hypothetical protein
VSDEESMYMLNITIVTVFNINIRETLADCITVVKYAKDNFMRHIKSPQIFTLGIFVEYVKSIPDAPRSHGDREILKHAMLSIKDFLDRAS